MGALVVIALAVSGAFPSGERFEAPPLWLFAAQLAAAVVVHVLVTVVGYRVPALAPGTDEATAGTTAGQAFLRGTIVRMSMCESIALASLAAAFAVDSVGYVAVLSGTAVALVLLLVHAWPHSGPVERTVAALERDGARSHLRERLGLPTGPIQEL